MPWFLKYNQIPNERWAFIDNVFTQEECEKIINLGKEKTLKKAAISNDVIDESVRKTNIAWFKTEDEEMPEYDWIYRRCTDAVNFINEKYFNYDLTFIEELQFTAYNEKGYFYGKHIDAEYDGLGYRKLSFKELKYLFYLYVLNFEIISFLKFIRRIYLNLISKQ